MFNLSVQVCTRLARHFRFVCFSHALAKFCCERGVDCIDVTRSIYTSPLPRVAYFRFQASLFTSSRNDHLYFLKSLFLLSIVFLKTLQCFFLFLLSLVSYIFLLLLFRSSYFRYFTDCFVSFEKLESFTLFLELLKWKN